MVGFFFGCSPRIVGLGGGPEKENGLILLVAGAGIVCIWHNLPIFPVEPWLMLVSSSRDSCIAGVEGRVGDVHRNDAGCLMQQEWASVWREIPDSGAEPWLLRLRVRYANTMGLGTPTFWVEGESRTRESACCKVLSLVFDGELRTLAASVFPELAHLLPWIGCSVLGPACYPARAMWFARKIDPGSNTHNFSQFPEGPDGPALWRYVMHVGGSGSINVGVEPIVVLSYQQPDALPPFEYVPHISWGAGKDRDLASARMAAIWPDATDEELCQESAALEVDLLARLPRIVAEFRRVLATTGLVVEVPDATGDAHGST